MIEVTAKPLNYGMVGGGRVALIGKVHRTSIALNRDCRLAAGAFSSLAVKNLASGRELGVDEDRIYASYAEMARKEAGRRLCVHHPQCPAQESGQKRMGYV